LITIKDTECQSFSSS